MDKKVYYREYSLKYWIELILKENLELPDYQRNFVWTKNQVQEFIRSLKKNLFVPPVTIGVCNIKGEKHNYILDGQQRLSSILLAYFNVYPKKEAFSLNEDAYIYADGITEEDYEDVEIEYINWSLRNMTLHGALEQKVRESITLKQYDTVDYDVDSDFFEDHYLPFSFIIPNVDDESEQQFYSSVFRNINILGTRLTPIESRQSLYFLKADLKDLFDPKCCRNFKVELVGKDLSYDFVRTMAILSQYKKDHKFNSLAQTYKSKMEKYYEEYIYAVVNDEENGMFAQFSTIFKKCDFTPRIELLAKAIHELEYNQLQFTSIIDSDIYMFGLVYYTVIEGKQINIVQKAQLKESLKLEIARLKEDVSHKSSPSLLKHMRDRVEQSIKIFKRYVIQSA